MSRILITGGAGSLGQALIERWRKTHELTILSRNPHKQQAVQERFDLPRSAFVLADICDYEAVREACLGQDVLIHAAALKVVSLGEQFPAEYTRVNVLGAQVVARAWEDVGRKSGFQNGKWLPAAREPRLALYINSDKGVAPINHYGCTKRIGEAIFVDRGWGSLRYGNVVASEGSFIHKWQAQLERGEPVTVRYPPPTRFFLSFGQALDLIDEALNLMNRGAAGVFAPGNLSAFDVGEVARAMTDGANICYTQALQPGEKQHEVLTAPGEVPFLVGTHLYQVKPGWETLRDRFSSETAPRMSGEDVLRVLGINPRQEVFA